MSAPYLGDFAEDATVHFKWSTNDHAGASITRGTNGTVSVYVGSSTTQLTTGVTDTEDFDSLTGIHHCTIDLSASATYAAGSECQVVLSAAAVDGQTVNAVLAHFSIERSGGALALLKSGTFGLSAIKTQTAAIEADTQDLQAQIGTDGAGLTNIPWNSAWDAEVQSEVADALAVYDPPTHAELTSGLDALPTAAEIRAEMDSNSTQLAAIVADTNELQTDWADGGRLDLILDARASQSSVDTIDNFLDTEIAAILEDTGTTIPATLSTIAGYIDTEVAAILVDTGTTLDGKLDTIEGIVDAIKVQTDKLTFSAAGFVDANVMEINDNGGLSGDGDETPISKA